MEKQLQIELENLEAYLLLSISREEMYAAPAGYFNKKKNTLIGLMQESDLSIPKNYFEQKKASLLEIMEEDVPEKALPKAKTIPLKRWMSIAAAIAIFAVAFPVMKNSFFQDETTAQAGNFQTILQGQTIFEEDEVAFLTDSSSEYFYDSFLVEAVSKEQQSDDLEQIENGSYFDSVEYL